MPRINTGRACNILHFVIAGSCLLATPALSVTLPARPIAAPSPNSSHSRPLKRTWRNGPASMPLDTEIVPPHPSLVPPRVRAHLASLQEEQNAKMGTESGQAAPLTLAISRTAFVPFKPAAKTIEPSPHSPASFDPEQQAVDDLNQLRADPKARQAFYKDLIHIVEQVRIQPSNPKTNPPATPHPYWVGVGVAVHCEQGCAN